MLCSDAVGAGSGGLEHLFCSDGSARKGTGKNGNGKETGKNAFLSFPVPTNFDQRKSVLPTLSANIFVIRHLFSVLFFATDSSLLCASVVS